jgi:hypothetical protein
MQHGTKNTASDRDAALPAAALAGADACAGGAETTGDSESDSELQSSDICTQHSTAPFRFLCRFVGRKERERERERASELARAHACLRRPHRYRCSEGVAW